MVLIILVCIMEHDDDEKLLLNWYGNINETKCQCQLPFFIVTKNDTQDIFMRGWFATDHEKRWEKFACSVDCISSNWGLSLDWKQVQNSMMQYDSHANFLKNKYDSSHLSTHSAKLTPKNSFLSSKIEHLASVLFRHFGTKSQVETHSRAAADLSWPAL